MPATAAKPFVDQLLEQHRRLIESEAAKYARFVPAHVVQAQAWRLARKAAESYDPSRGTKFSTHLVSSLRKLFRLTTKHGGGFRVPENKQFKVHRLTVLEEQLRNELRRPPTVDELSEASGMGRAAVNGLMRLRKREVNVSNLAYSPVFIEGNNDDWVHFVYHDLTPRDKVIMEHRTGFGGKEVKTNEEIAKLLGTSPSTVSARTRMITERLKEGWK
jgi:DNA-directed RNA polymerase specialized sigma subunit